MRLRLYEKFPGRDLPKGEAPSSELQAWAAAQKKLAEKGGLSAERRDYLASVMDL